MADNTTLPGTGEAVRSIDKAGKKTQVVTLDLGGAGVEALTAGTVPVSGTVAVSGTVPVSGAFWQATQPVSGTVALDSTSLAALETISVANFPATQAVSGTVGISGTVPVSGPLTDTQLRATALPVSGTFWQTTQPVSGSVSVSNFPASQAVTGTFWQATQPVSIASMPSTPVTGTFWQATQPVSLAALPALVAGTATVGRVTPAMQVARVLVCITFTSTAAAAADTLLTVTINKGGTITTGTTVPVTAGKTLRLTGAVLSLRTTTAANPWGLLSIRLNTAGAAVIGSPVIVPVGVAGTAAVIGNTGFSNPCVDDGLEFSGTNQLGFSFANNVATNVTNFSVFGYEYTTPS